MKASDAASRMATSGGSLAPASAGIVGTQRSWCCPDIQRQPDNTTNTNTMNIGCLGWGSLIWNPKNLLVRNGWFHDGPLLPIEFARCSSEDRVTLVLVPTMPSVRALWCLLSAVDLRAAVDELATRESVPNSKDHNIGFWARTSGSRGSFADLIGIWAAAHQLDAVVWTNLGPKWSKVEGRVPSVIEVLDFVRSQGPDSKAADYVS